MAFWDPITRLLRDIKRILLDILALLEKMNTGPTTTIGLRAEAIIPKEGTTTMPAITPITVDTSQNVQYTTSPKDANGNPTVPSLAWTSSDVAVIFAIPAADTLSALATTVAPGVATITATDPATGVFDSQEVTVTVVAPPATVTIGLVGTAVPK